MTQQYDPTAERRGTGVYTLADIKDRCRIDDETGCWMWGMWSREGDTPRIKLPPGVIVGCDQRTMSVPRVAWMMRTKQPLQNGLVVWRTCATPACCNPSHLRAGTKSQEGEFRRTTGMWRGDQARAVINRANVASSQALSPDLVRAILQSIADGDTRAAAAARHGVCKAVVSRIALGRHIHQRPLRAASIFARG